eukprot:TRINITY_DN10586_c0_g1_i1.p1 TRINITY_DN10586_c0_g1~~TRINITY_DN10586_c0_g1_i1.p1  ORF type:complete len:707 (+),score=72.35 TRINITY_DN10586_c0_g1_i1:32-2152(+)
MGGTQSSASDLGLTLSAETLYTTHKKEPSNPIGASSGPVQSKVELLVEQVSEGVRKDITAAQQEVVTLMSSSENLPELEVYHQLSAAKFGGNPTPAQAIAALLRTCSMRYRQLVPNDTIEWETDQDDVQYLAAVAGVDLEDKTSLDTMQFLHVATVITVCLVNRAGQYYYSSIDYERKKRAYEHFRTQYEHDLARKRLGEKAFAAVVSLFTGGHGGIRPASMPVPPSEPKALPMPGSWIAACSWDFKTHSGVMDKEDYQLLMKMHQLKKQYHNHTQTTLYTWGSAVALGNEEYNKEDVINNRHGDLIITYPTPVTFFFDKARIIDVIPGGIALLEDGSVYSWGSNSRGAKGQPASTTDKPSHEEQLIPSPVQISLPRPAVAIHRGLAVLDDGSLYGWGCNKWGQLGLPCTQPNPWGNNDKDCYYEPVRVPVDEAVDVVWSGGQRLVVSCKESGKIYCCGCNQNGELGITGRQDTRVEGLTEPSFPEDLFLQQSPRNSAKTRLLSVSGGWNSAPYLLWLFTNNELYITGRTYKHTFHDWGIDTPVLLSGMSKLLLGQTITRLDSNTGHISTKEDPDNWLVFVPPEHQGDEGCVKKPKTVTMNVHGSPVPKCLNIIPQSSAHFHTALEPLNDSQTENVLYTWGGASQAGELGLGWAQKWDADELPHPVVPLKERAFGKVVLCGCVGGVALCEPSPKGQAAYMHQLGFE